ncbi:hypothetical protein BDW71DRAFT_199121 [Aspergillus fruticulosus]
MEGGTELTHTEARWRSDGVVVDGAITRVITDGPRPGRLEGQIVLISGSSQGFGRDILETFLREGALVSGLDLQAIDGPVEGFPYLFGKAASIVVHNAGWSYSNKSGLDVTVEEFDRLFNLNVHSIYLASKVLVPEMKKNGPGSTVVAEQTWYNATKAGVSSATKLMALEFARDQLRFNTICPTSGNTSLLNKFAGISDGPVPPDIIKAKYEVILLGRLPASSIIGGVEILVDSTLCV